VSQISRAAACIPIGSVVRLAMRVHSATRRSSRSRRCVRKSKIDSSGERGFSEIAGGLGVPK
jgi:hypothetical protein